jgi:hypothetical protein
MAIKTRALLGAAYRRADAVPRTHAINLATGAALCGRVKPEHVADEEATNEDLPATCPVCAKKDPRRPQHPDDGPFMLKSILQF